ncbi:MAG TPA: NAD(P)-dependent oxidoreductase [Verrucomicrobiales bacterium]|jgi:3-hydroxyisobutyrate dehydrogenase-like beta-hydroxyacid dehydrogenase|nr:NAD(P)-dependent oxidoreductase [Verrucomicrobiales bacterium]
MTSTAVKTVGIAGLGIIGTRVAANLRAKGFGVRVWNRTPKEKEQGFVASLEVLARESEVIQIFVRDAPALREVIAGLSPALTKGKTVINCATVSLNATKDVAKLVKKTGADFLDIPFTGSRDAAENGQLTYYAGGPPKLVERMRPVLEASAKAVLYTGEVGTATVLKIATNMVSAVTVQALAEALGVVQAGGVPLEMFQQAMEHNANCSGLVRMKLPSMIRKDFTPHFSLKNMLKDARYALALAGQGNMEVPVLTSAAACMAGLEAAGRGDEDYSVLAEHYVGKASKE